MPSLPPSFPAGKEPTADWKIPVQPDFSVTPNDIPGAHGARRERAEFDETALVYLRALSVRYPTIDATLAAIAKLRAFLTLRKGTVHGELVVTGRVGAERVCDFIQRFAS